MTKARIKPKIARIRGDTKAISTWGAIGVVMLFFVGSWYLVAAVSDDIPYPHEWLETQINEPSIPENEITFDGQLVNRLNQSVVTWWESTAPGGESIDYLDIEPDDEETHEQYEIVMTTNAPAVRIGVPYQIYINAELHYTGTNEFKQYAVYDISSGSGDKTYTYRLDHDLLAYDTVLGGSDWTEIEVKLINPNGEVLGIFDFGVG